MIFDSTVLADILTTAQRADQGLVPLRQKINQYLNAASAPPALKWAAPATITTDQFVGDYLKAHAPQFLQAGYIPNPATFKYEPCLWDTHLSEASAALDRCLARQNEIYALETQAIAAFLDLALEEALQSGNLALAKVGLKATRRQADAAAGDADEPILTAQDTLRSQARQVRLALHNADGHPLNYGQRIQFLREMYAESIQTIYERLTAVRLGHPNTMASDWPEMPRWNPDGWDNLHQIVRWCRIAIRDLDEKQIRERTRLLVCALETEGLCKDVASHLRLSGDSRFTFTLTSDHFAGEGGKPRILSVGVALAFSNALGNWDKARAIDGDRMKFSMDDAYTVTERNSWRFSAELTPPEQGGLPFPGRIIHWRRPTLYFQDEVQAWRNPEANQCPTGTGSHIRNTSPIGQWEVLIKDHRRLSNGRSVPLSNQFYLGEARWEPQDIMVFMQVAKR